MVARLGNFPYATEAAIAAAAAQAQKAGARLVIFRGDEVLGYRDLVEETARAFESHHLLFGYVEIAQQKGEDEFAEKMASHLVRVHSITDADLEKTSAAMAVARYARAVARARDSGLLRALACWPPSLARGKPTSTT